MQSRKLIVANWKVNGSRVLCDEYRNMLDEMPDAPLVICPPFPYLGQFHSPHIRVGAQNGSVYESGAHTSEISVKMLSEFRCQYAIIGHSEVREAYGDSDTIIREKAQLLYKANIVPIICVGENEISRKSGRYINFVKSQLVRGLPLLGDENQRSEIIIAYEPIWSIGTGNTASLAQIDEMTAEITNMVKDFYIQLPKLQVTVLYGGSVNANNAEEILRLPYIDGLLVGSASLDPHIMMSILEKCRG